MPSPRSRRSVLRLTSVALGVGVAGCPSAPSRRTTTTPTGSTSSTPSDGAPRHDHELAFGAEVLQQASTESPARIQASLTNTSSRSRRVGFGPALLFTDNDASDRLAWPDDVLLVADTNTGMQGAPTEPREGCWRFPEDGERLTYSILGWRTLAPGESMSESYSVYTDYDAPSCLPPGEYRFPDEGYYEDESTALRLTLTVTIDENHQLSASTEHPAISPSEQTTEADDQPPYGTQFVYVREVENQERGADKAPEEGWVEFQTLSEARRNAFLRALERGRIEYGPAERNPFDFHDESRPEFVNYDGVWYFVRVSIV